MISARGTFAPWAAVHLLVFLLWGNLLSQSAATGQRSLFFIVFAVGLALIAAANRFRGPRWLCSIVLFTIFEPPAIMMLHPVAVGGLTILPYKIIPLLALAAFLAQRTWSAAHGQRPAPWGTPQWALLGVAILCFTAFIAAALSLAPVTATGKAFTLCLAAVALVTTTALASSPDEPHLARTLSLAIWILFGLTLLQALHYFGLFPDRFLWFRFEEGMWLRFGVIGPQRAYASFHNPNYFPLWAMMALLVLRHLGGAHTRHYILVFLLSVLSLSASGVGTTLLAFVLPRVPRAFRSALFAILLVGPLIALPIVRATPLPDRISTGSGRQYIAWAAANAVYSSPVYGIGVGVMDQHFERWGPSNYHNSARVAHNFTWETMVSAGLLGVLGLYLLYLSIYRQTRQSASLQAALLSFLVWGQWQPGLTWMPIWILLGLLLGLGVARALETQTRAPAAHA